jgi:hypothetical protein
MASVFPAEENQHHRNKCERLKKVRSMKARHPRQTAIMLLSLSVTRVFLSFFLSWLFLFHHQEVSSVHECDDSSFAAAAATGAVVGRWG